MFRPLQITIHLDGSGLYYDPGEPLMLDGILAAALCRWHVHGEPPARDEQPHDIPLPLDRWYGVGGVWGWRASALVPDGVTTESLVHWRKRFQQDRVDLTSGSPNLTNGVYRDWNMPLPLLLAPRMISYAVGEAKEIRRALKRDIRWLGKKRSHGRGRVVGVEVVDAPTDWSLVKDNKAMRWLPDENGARVVRPRPPYWNTFGRVKSCEVGDHRTV